jgi:hypothetical protein
MNAAVVPAAIVPPRAIRNIALALSSAFRNSIGLAITS